MGTSLVSLRTIGLLSSSPFPSSPSSHQEAKWRQHPTSKPDKPASPAKGRKQELELAKGSKVRYARRLHLWAAPAALASPGQLLKSLLTHKESSMAESGRKRICRI